MDGLDKGKVLYNHPIQPQIMLSQVVQRNYAQSIALMGGKGNQRQYECQWIDWQFSVRAVKLSLNQKYLLNRCNTRNNVLRLLKQAEKLEVAVMCTQNTIVLLCTNALIHNEWKNTIIFSGIGSVTNCLHCRSDAAVTPTVHFSNKCAATAHLKAFSSTYTTINCQHKQFLSIHYFYHLSIESQTHQSRLQVRRGVNHGRSRIYLRAYKQSLTPLGNLK